MTYSGSILFDIDLINLDPSAVPKSFKNIVLSFDRLKVENVFSFKSGPIFKIYNMNGEKIRITDSEFKSFKGGSAEQLI